MNPIILPPAIDKIVGQTMFFSLGDATSLREGKLWNQTLKSNLRLQIDLVSYPAWAEGSVNMDKITNNLFDFIRNQIIGRYELNKLN